LATSSGGSGKTLAGKRRKANSLPHEPNTKTERAKQQEEEEANERRERKVREGIFRSLPIPAPLFTSD
jgi:hypothetical protein